MKKAGKQRDEIETQQFKSKRKRIVKGNFGITLGEESFMSERRATFDPQTVGMENRAIV